MTSIIPRLPYLWEEICGTAPAPTPAPTPEPTPTPTPTPPPAAPGPQFTGNGGAPATISVEEGAVDVYRFFTIHGEAPFLWSVSGGPAAVVINSFGVLRYLTGMPLLTNPLVVVVRVTDRLGRFDEQQLTIEVRPKVIVNPSPSRLTFGAILGDPVVGNTLTYVPDTWANATTVERRWTIDDLLAGDAYIPLPLFDLHAHAIIGVWSKAVGPHGTTIESIVLPAPIGQVAGTAFGVSEGLSSGAAAKTLAAGDAPIPVSGGAAYAAATGLRRNAGGGLSVIGGDAVAYGHATISAPRFERHVFRVANLGNSLRVEFGVCLSNGWLGKGGNASGYMVMLDRTQNGASWSVSNPAVATVVKHNGDAGPGVVLRNSGALDALADAATVTVTIREAAFDVRVEPDVGPVIEYAAIADTLYRTPRVQIGDVVAGNGKPKAVLTFDLGVGDASVPIPIEDRYQLVYNEEWEDEDRTRVNADGLPRPGQNVWTNRLPWDDTINGESQVYGADTFEIADSILTIKATWDDAEGVWRSDAITTFKSFNRLYGVTENRFRLDLGPGLWPGDWDMGITDTWPGKEQDRLEADGGRPRKIYHALHRVNPATGEDVPEGAYPDIPHGRTIDQWTTVSTQWLPSGETIWRVHGLQTARMSHDMHEPSYIILNLAIAPTGQPDFWITNPDGTTPSPGRYQIDYIRVYQRPSHTAGLPVITQRPTITRTGDTVTIKHGLSNATTVRGVLRTGTAGGAKEVASTAITRTGGGPIPDTTIELTSLIDGGKINWYEVHTGPDGRYIQTGSDSPLIWWVPPTGPVGEVEITGVTAQSPGNSFVPAGYTGPLAYLRNVFAPGGLVDATDYSLRQWRRTDLTWPAQFRFEWSFPATSPTPYEFCWGYPALMWGAGPWGYPYGTSGHVTPMRAKDVGTFTIDVDLTFSGANNADVLVDIYTMKGSTAPVFDGDYHNEISILLSHNGVGPIDWLTTEATATRTFPAPLGDCAIYKQPTSRQIMVMPRTGSLRRDVMTGLIDAGEVVDHLISIGLVEPNGWLAGFEIGVETQRPNAWNSAPYAGDLRFNQAPVVAWSGLEYALRVGEQMQITGSLGSPIDGLSGKTWGHTVRHHYSKQGPWNADGSRLLLMNWGGDPGSLFLDGRTFVALSVPTFHMDESRWHPINPLLLYYVTGNQVRLRNVASGSESTVYTWAGRDSVSFGNGEGNFSDDGRYVVLTAGAEPWPPEPVQAMGVLDTLTGTLSVIDHGGWYIDNATISPSGAYLVVNGGPNSGESNGVRVYTRAGAFLGSLPHLTASHFDVTVFGGVEYLVGTALQEPHFPKITAWRLGDLAVTPWAAGGYGWHTSARNTQARHLGVLASMFPAPTSSTQGNQAILVRPSSVTVAVPDLAFPGSDYNDYWAQPQATISPDGTHVVWARRINGSQISAWVRRIG